MHVIYVDDEQPALNNFRMTVASFLDIDSLHTFQSGEEALFWATHNPVDAAFLDMEMPGLHGLELARQLKETNDNIRIVFVTAYNQYALDAFNVGAVGYVIKPYMRSDIRKELDKAALIRNKTEKRVIIQTIPSFSVTIDGEPFRPGREKALELLALLVENGERGITAGEAISALWPDRPNDTTTQSLFRVTYKRLSDALEKVGMPDLLISHHNRRFLQTAMVDCDLYRILEGDVQAAKKYYGQYLQEYEWSDERNGQLHRMILDKDFWS